MGNKAPTLSLAQKFEAIAAQSVTTLSGDSLPVRSFFEDGGAVVVLVRRMG